MINNKTLVWLTASAGVALVVTAAIAVASTDWGSGRDTQVRATRGASGGDTTSRRSSYRGSSNRFLIKFDANKDGRITRAEVDAGIVAEFQSIDTNHDGRLDAMEYRAFNDALRARRRAWRQAHPDGAGAQDPGRPQTVDTMKRLDWNLDGFVSLEEWSGRTRGAAMRADRDGDGVIIADDLTRPRARRTSAAR